MNKPILILVGAEVPPLVGTAPGETRTLAEGVTVMQGLPGELPQETIRRCTMDAPDRFTGAAIYRIARVGTIKAWPMKRAVATVVKAGT